MSDDPKLSQRYRELPPEEPPRALDDAILAASRRAVDARPAPLLGPGGRRRWYFPLAAAAVIVLAVAVTVHVERERPDGEAVSGPVATQEAKRKEQPAPAQDAPRPIAKKPAPAQPAFTPDPQPQAKAESAPERRNEMQERAAERDLAPSAMRQDASGPQAPAPAAAPPVAAAQGRAAESEMRQERARVQGARSADEVRAAAPLAKLSMRSPEQWLQGIDDLKRQGRHDEAEKELAEFRKRYPNYRIPEAISEKFEKR